MNIIVNEHRRQTKYKERLLAGSIRGPNSAAPHERCISRESLGLRNKNCWTKK